MPKKSTTVLDAHGTNLEQALKAKRDLSRLYAQQTEAMDGAVDKAKAKFKVKIDKLLAGLSPEVLELVKPAETATTVLA